MKPTRRAFFSVPTVVVLSLATALAGCAVGPRYTSPEIAVPASFDGVVSSGVTPANASDPAHWWQSLHDPILERLITLALDGNLDLQTARSRIVAARAQQRAASAGLLPALDGKVGANRIDFSENAGLSSLASSLGGGSAGGGKGKGTIGQGVAGPGSGISTWSLGLDASWELDLFGGVASSITGSQARTEAAQWQARDMQVALTAEVASSYLMLRTLQEQTTIAEQELGRQHATLKLVSARRQVGLINELPQRQQALQLSNLAATLPQLAARIKAQVHALGVLTGGGANAPIVGQLLADQRTGTASAGSSAITEPPFERVAPVPTLMQLPLGLPSTLLQRRPDIRAAERQLAAASADINVATADLYPRFNLIGMAELISTSLSTLLQRASLQTVASAGITLPLFDGGKRRATLATVESNADSALLSYKKAVLVAVQDVEDALADYDAELTRHTELQHGLADARQLEKLARASYTAGLVDFREVLDAQAAVLSSRNSLSQSQGLLLTRLVRVYKALGGGWDSV